MDCEYSKYGCSTKLANLDHVQAHYYQHSISHLRLVSSALDTEVEKSKTLTVRVTSLEKEREKYISKLDEIDSKFKAFQAQVESKLASLNDYTPPTTPTFSASSGTIPLSSSSGERSSVSFSSGATSPTPSSSPPRSSPLSAAAAKDVAPKPSYRPPSRVDAPTPRAPPITTRSISSVALKDIDIKEKKTNILSHSATEFVKDKYKQDPGYDEARSLTMEDIDGFEKGIIWGYDYATGEWSRGTIHFRMEKTAFAEGALRGAYKVTAKDSLTDASDSPPERAVLGDKKLKKDLPSSFGDLGAKYVAKISKNKVAIDRYFEDVKMQMICLELGKKFNNFNPPKPVQFLPAWVLEIPTRSPPVYCGLEPYVEGEFVKLSNNYGAVLSDRNTPAALSHFSWETTNHTYLVIDIQGVKDFYTDPQIHTKDGKGFGLGNLGMNGIDRFLKTHKCNAICQMLALPLINQIETSKRRTMTRGTMKVPFIEDQLGPGATPKWETPYDTAHGDFQCVQTISGHEDRVTSLYVTSKYLIAGLANGDLKVYNIGTLTVHTTVNVHRKSVNCITANETYLFTASDDHSVKAWSIDKFEPHAQLRDHTGEVNSLALSDKTLSYLASAGFDKNIKIWNTRTMKYVNTLEGHTKAIKTLAISGSILFSGSNDGSIMMWSLKYMSCIFTIEAHDGWVKTLTVKDRTLYSGAFDYMVKVWDILTFTPKHTLTAHNDDVLAVMATDKFLVTASNDRSVMLWDYNTHKCIANLRGHRSGVQALATDGKNIFSRSDDYNIRVWKFVQR
jgi:myosin-heavy-chain kinase